LNCDSDEIIEPTGLQRPDYQCKEYRKKDGGSSKQGSSLIPPDIAPCKLDIAHTDLFYLFHILL
jgi:hypothetical protein